MTSSNILMPTEAEIRWWVLHVTQHAYNIEYFLQELGLGSQDPQRPHDIVGLGNKFEWEVMCGYAIQRRDRSRQFFETHVLPSLKRHRCQHHHVMWNEPNERATVDDMKLGAVDAVCSLLEPREYQGGAHSFDQVLAIVPRNSMHKQPWIIELVSEMRKLPMPPIERIESLNEIPNVGVSRNTHDIVRQRVEETRRYLRDTYGACV